MLDKKQIWAILLFEIKMDHKAVETTCNISNAFGPATTNGQCSGGSRSFAKESWSWGVQWLAIGSWQWSRIIKADPLNNCISCQRTPYKPFYGHLPFEANWKDEKAQEGRRQQRNKN